MIFGLAINLEEQTPRPVKFGVQGTILAGTLLVIALLGWPLLRNAVAEMRRGRLTIEALFLLTMTGAMFASLQSLFSGIGPIYFEVVTVLLVVYSLGKMIGARSRAVALAAARGWTKGLTTCRLVDAQSCESRVDVATVQVGDQIVVYAGETIAVDGVIRDGTGFVSESLVNGEPFAVVKRPGDPVLAGTVAHDAVLRIEATVSGAARQIDRMLETIQAAAERPTLLQAQADRLGRFFFPVIVGTAMVTFVFWALQSGWHVGLFNAMSVLLVACPCALGLATPIVFWSALNRLAERGLVAHRGDVIERLAQVDHVVFDKTGTLTDEHFSIVDIATLADGDERRRILGWLSFVEAQCNHPIARPFAMLPQDFATNRSPRLITHRSIPGCGIEATLQDGQTIHYLRVGRPDWLHPSACDEAEALRNRLHAKLGHRVDFEIDGKLAAIALISERVRDTAADAVDGLRHLGLPVVVLTGDATERALALGFGETKGGLLPDDKKRWIERVHKEGGKAMMIGDGVNDASALAVAHAGISLASGSDLANRVATATLYHGDLRTIPWAISLCRDAMRTVHRNLLRAAAYNLVGIVLAACGVLHPVAAALLMVVSSLWVAWSSVRVGAAAEYCHYEKPHAFSTVRSRTGVRIRALIHALALGGQAFAATLLLDLESELLVVSGAVFVAIGILSSYLWLRASHLPHWLDMSFGMVTLGNLGMLIGWWIDNGCARLHDVGCCNCIQAMREGRFKPWMWAGMLIGANVAMRLLQRRIVVDVPCRVAMYTGGNAGMVAGMLAGGWVIGSFQTASVSVAALLDYLGMTAGMIVGMLSGTAITQKLMFWFKGARFGRQLTTTAPPASEGAAV